MSSPHPFLKLPVLIIGVVILVLIGLSTGLRNKSKTPDREFSEEGTGIERVDAQSSRITDISAPAGRVTDRGQNTASRAPVKRQAPRKQIVENYETSKRRSEGDSVIVGRVFGNEREESGSQRDWGRGGDRSWGSSDSSGGSTAGGTDNFAGFSGFSGGFFDRTRSDNNTSESEQRRREWGQRRDERTSGSDRANFSGPWGDLKPIESAEVLLFENDPNTTHPALRTVYTDKEGSFTIANVNGADQRYILVVKADKFAPEATSILVNEEPRPVFMRLNKGVAVRGKVVDSLTSEPISGAVVYQPNPRYEASSAMGVTTTSITGEFYFPNTHPGRNVTLARAEGYATTRARVRAPDESTLIEMEPGGASISGVTIDRLTGKPQGGARVWAKADRNLNESVVSADDGTFRIANLPAGQFTVYAMRGMKSEEQTVELDRGQDIADIEIKLPTDLLVSGQVISAKDRKPLEGIKVWFQSSKGAQYRKTNIDGQFAFETMAIDEYAILIREKGYLPIQDKKSSESRETIVRKVDKNQSSDELTIRLRPVPTVAGNVKAQSRRGNGEQPASNAEVKLSYENGRNFYELKTQTDPAGNFFFNLDNGGRGSGIILAQQQFSMDFKEVRVPRENPIQLSLEREFMIGQVLLVDETPLDGTRVEISRALNENREDSRSAHRVTLSQMNVMQGGRMFGPLPRGQKVDMTFILPDGVSISKAFQTNRLLDSRPIFVYDPVAQDIIADTTPRENRGGRGGRGGQDNRGGQNNNGNGSQGSNNPPPATASNPQ